MELKKFRWFWAWDDEKEEAWLRAMAKEGWHFRQVEFPGRYVFAQGAFRDDVYRLDFFIDSKKKAEYLQLFQDAGWEYAGEYGSCQYFRKAAAPGEDPQIYTDNASKAAKYGRLMVFLVVFSPIWFIGLNRASQSKEPVLQALTFIGFLFMLLYIYAMLKLIKRVSRLTKK